MQYRPLGKTDLTLSEIGFGCASFWGKPTFSESEAIALVHTAAERGVTYFDTGSSYSGGNAEPRLAKAIASLPGRHDLVIATKAGSRNGKFDRPYLDYSPTWIEKSIETSLRRLKLNAIPLLHLHGPRPADLTDELLTLLTRMKEQGKVRHFGTNNGNIETIRLVATIPIFESVMTNYSILQPERSVIIDHLASRGIGVLAGMAAAGGLLAPKHPMRSFRDAWYTVRAWKNHRTELERARRLALQGDNRETSAIAIAWVLRNANVTSAIFSTTRLDHLLQNIGAANRHLDDALMNDIEIAQSRFF
jgi:aryl-alcohol dehydrogenase-like predicted oxidoreductase